MEEWKWQSGQSQELCWMHVRLLNKFFCQIWVLQQFKISPFVFYSLLDISCPIELKKNMWRLFLNLIREAPGNEWGASNFTDGQVSGTIIDGRSESTILQNNGWDDIATKWIDVQQILIQSFVQCLINRLDAWVRAFRTTETSIVSL